jgi:glutathione synthase/RimK-type ligase-like ATP-grasp enzyme
LSTPAPNNQNEPKTPFVGLAPFLRASIAGTDLRPLGQELLEKAQHDENDAELWLNLSIVMQCLGQRDLGLSIQSAALEQKRAYHLAASQQPAKLRLLVLSVPGDISANTPIDCLLENSDVDLIFYYVSADDPLATPVPEHDAVFVAIADSDDNRHILTSLDKALAHWPKPVINKPQYIPLTDREEASRLLNDAPGVLIPPTLRASRTILLDIAECRVQLENQFNECGFPVIARPIGSQGGRDLEKIENPQQLAAYLDKVNETDFFLSRFIDYSAKDGLFRKFRIVLIDGKPYASHMGVSSHWMVHYVNAGMYEDAGKRDEEAFFMEHFNEFVERHRTALDAIHERTKLDYLCIDCAETQDGQLLIFEIDHTMVVHAMDPENIFPYKQPHMHKAIDAFRDYLLRLTDR